MSDRVIVMREGRVTGEIERATEHFNQESIMKAAWEVRCHEKEYEKCIDEDRAAAGADHTRNGPSIYASGRKF